MRKHKFLAGLLALVMLLSLMPVAAFAAEGEVETEGLTMSKTATLEEDGTYTIDLSAYSTGSTTTQSIKAGVPLDIVIILDQSGSMAYKLTSDSAATSESEARYYKLRTEVKNFVDSIAANAAEYKVEHRVSLVGFANGNSTGTSNPSLSHTSPGSNANYWMNTGIFIDGKLKNYGADKRNSDHQLTADDYKKSLVTIPEPGVVPDARANAYANIAANGGTYTEYGLTMAANVFANNEQRDYTDANGNAAKSQRVVILFTDGASNSTDNANIAGAYTLKNTYGAKVYTVSMLSSENEVLNYMSSNYPTISSTSDTQTTTTYEAVYGDEILTSETYYINDNGTYTEVKYGTFTDSYSYTPITGNPSTSETYYILEDNGGYTEVVYKYGGWYRTWFLIGVLLGKVDPSTVQFYTRDEGVAYTGWYYESWGNNVKVQPKSSSADSVNTQFYKKVVTGGVTASDTKYYTNINNMSDLGNIFTNIVEDVTSSSTSVTLDAPAYLQDVLADGFVLPAGVPTSNVEVKTYAMTTDGTTYTQGAETITAYSLKVESVTNGIKVSGFNYSTKYVSTGHAGEILKVKITGILPTDDAITNAIIDTNDSTSGIYGKDASGEEVSFPFEQPKTILTSKSYVV
ncbi:MAG: VWA domain-containing protein, partial [Oscillospiraceae bacterium]|nr:VWA domain-containing protein [Oscillospiraceae bacterium]